MSMAPNELSFTNLVKDLEVDEAACRLYETMVPLPTKRYVIVFTARSGSSWLTEVLSQTKLLGYPEEYLNPDFVRSVASYVKSVEQETFLTALQRHRKTPNDIFGIELAKTHVDLFGAEIFYEAFKRNTAFFYLWRENLVAQAVSLFRAATTQHFHTQQGETSPAPPAYDEAGIDGWFRHLAAHENANLDMLVQWQRPFVNLCYEQMIVSRENTLKLFASVLAVELPAEILAVKPANPLEKISDDWNKDAERRFRASQPDLIATVERARKIKHYILSRAHGKIMQPSGAAP